MGAHRFYVGKIGTAFAFLFTLGFLYIGVIYDLVLIATGEFRDAQGRRVVNWD
jgi:TM2 domain-containing membrane protein YozV